MFRRRKKNNGEGKIAHKITTIDGIKFDSKMESDFYLHLKELKAKGIIEELELQPAFLLQPKYIVVDNKIIDENNKNFNKIKKETKAETVRAIKYVADFKVKYTNEKDYKIYDVKGISTTEFELKRKLFMYRYPEYTFKVIAYNKNKQEWVDFYKNKKEKKKAKK